ncbi:MAG: molybdopterin cofactor-binding domain-containing protein [Peptococcaceae bacterium]|nr:molybdopterin cofactor-binding domain-containing protein [Peptococcaceae bacterium]MEE0205785.1 molybdopterin cofactor-binding domain-containing protein [Peptococcaceae bacterium]
MIKRTFIVNGVTRQVLVEENETLASFLRERLLLTGCKIGCGQGHCGACNVIVDGKVTRSCITKLSRLPDNAEITTIEGIGTLSDMHPLQVAWMAHGCAQCGFCSPGFIMTSKVLLDNNPNPTREEVRDWFQQNRNLCRCTGYKPLVDAVMDAARVIRGEITKEDLVFKPTGDSIVGTSYIRPSAAQKVTGSWDFGADDALKMPKDTLRLALVQAEVSHALLKGVDTSEAEKMPGVFKVITAKDVPGKNRINGLVMLPLNNKCDGWDRPILCDEKIFQFGDAIAIVAADTEEHARAAAAAVKVDIEELPAYMNAMDAIAEDAIEIHPGTPNAYYETNCIKGPDMDFDAAPNVVEIESYCSRQPHLHLEPDCGYAYIDEDGMLTIHSKSIGLHLHMPMIADGIGVPLEKLRLVQNHTGGTFGYKFSPTNEAILGVAALVCQRPVSLVFNMYQNITYTGKRSPAFMHIKLAADENGKLLGLWGDNYIDHGPYSEFGDLLTHRLSQFTGAGYHIPTIRNKSQTVFTNHAWGSAFRGYGSPQSFMGSEIAIDVLAAKMGMDPFDIRELNCYKESEHSTIPTGYEPDVYCLEEMYKVARPLYEAGKKRVAEKNAASDGRYKYGIGVSSGVYGSGLDGVDSSQAYAELNPDGSVTMYVSWEDHGQGADMGTLVSAHETLRQAGITPEQIHLVMNDTKVTPNSGPAGGSRSQVMTGNACRLAAENLLAAMKKDDGTYRTYDEMVAEGIETKVLGQWVATACADRPIDQATAQGDPFSVYMYTLFLPEVCVDTETGKVTVEKFTCVADVGTIMNKLLVDGSFYGGLAQGIGLALSENFEDLEKHTTLLKCGIPYPKDVPDDIELHYVQTPRPNGPYGAAGCGEAPLDAPHPAILNAIYNATGARIMQVPATPDVVKAALDELN